jgi:hypothetical protein
MTTATTPGRAGKWIALFRTLAGAIHGLYPRMDHRIPTVVSRCPEGLRGAMPDFTAGAGDVHVAAPCPRTR